MHYILYVNGWFMHNILWFRLFTKKSCGAIMTPTWLLINFSNCIQCVGLEMTLIRYLIPFHHQFQMNTIGCSSGYTVTSLVRFIGYAKNVDLENILTNRKLKIRLLMSYRKKGVNCYEKSKYRSNRWKCSYIN